MSKKLKHLIEGIFLYIIKFIVCLLPLKTSSKIGSVLARNIGVLLKVNKTAKKTTVDCKESVISMLIFKVNKRIKPSTP